MKLRKIGAILLGAGMLGATLAPLVAAKDVPQSGFFVNTDGTPAAMIIVGDGAAASDVVSASLIAAKIGSIAVKTETVTLPGVQHSVTHTDIGPGDTVVDVPDATPYGGVASGNYTLDSLWWFDDNGGVLYGDSDGKFDPWETHEEIQIRFDDLYLFNSLMGLSVQDHKADLIGGDFNFWGLDPTVWIVPGLIYRVDNIRSPPMLDVQSDYLVWQKTPLHEREWRSDNRPPAQPEIPGNNRVDLDFHYNETLFVPDPYFWYYGGQPKFKFFGKTYNVVDAKTVMNYNTRTGEVKNPFGTPMWSPFLVTGKAEYWIEQYFYRDQAEEYGGYEITLRDVDVDHNKAYFKITDPRGDALEFWMVLDPEHGFSPTLQKQSQTGEYPERTGWSKDDLFFDRTWVTFKDDFGDLWLIGDYVAFAMDGISTFVGAGGTGGVLMNLYAVAEPMEWYTTQCCIPYVEEPNSYSLYLERYPSLGYLGKFSKSTSQNTDFYPDQEDGTTWPPMPPGNDYIYDPQNLPSLYNFSYSGYFNLWETVETWLQRAFSGTFNAQTYSGTYGFPIDFNSNIDNYNNVTDKIGWAGLTGPPMITSNPDFWLDESPSDWSPDIIASTIYRAWRLPPNDLDRQDYEFLGMSIEYTGLPGSGGAAPMPAWAPELADAPSLANITFPHAFKVYGIPWWMAGEGWIDLDDDGYLTFIDFDEDGLADVWRTPTAGGSYDFANFDTEINPNGSDPTYVKYCTACTDKKVYTKDGFPSSAWADTPDGLASPWTFKPPANGYHYVGDTFGGWDPGPDNLWGVANVDDDGNGFEDDNGEQGWPGSDDLRVGCSAGVNIVDNSTVGDNGIVLPPYDCGGDDFRVPGDDFHWTGFDWMYEFNIGLCETFEMIKCVQAYVFVGPNEYFKLDMSDITWDDNNDGWGMYGGDGRPGLKAVDDDGNGVIDDPGEYPAGDDRPEDNGIDWRTIMEISQGTYDQLVKVNIDPTMLVKLDIEITEAEKQNYNLILIGGPVANRITKEIVDLGILPNDGSTADWMYTSTGDYKMYSNPYGTGKDVLIVAGANREETRLAAEDLIAHM